MRRNQNACPLQAMLLVVVVGHTVISSRVRTLAAGQLMLLFSAWTVTVVAKQGGFKVTSTGEEAGPMPNEGTVHAGLGTPPVEPEMVNSSLQKLLPPVGG